jgi:hypothetical protein
MCSHGQEECRISSLQNNFNNHNSTTIIQQEDRNLKETKNPLKRTRKNLLPDISGMLEKLIALIK